MTIGERIKKRREELGLTQAELAERLGYKSRAAICTVEKDKEDMTTTRIRKYAMALGVSPGYLMGWEPEADEDYTYAIPVDNIEFAKKEKKIEKRLDISFDNHLVLEYDKPDDAAMVMRAMKYYELYQNASQEIQSAVDAILKSVQPSEQDQRLPEYKDQ